MGTNRAERPDLGRFSDHGASFNPGGRIDPAHQSVSIAPTSASATTTPFTLASP